MVVLSIIYWTQNNLHACSCLFQNLCKQLYEKIDIVDEERYDCEAKVMKHNNDVSITLNRYCMLSLHGKVLRECGIIACFIIKSPYHPRFVN